MNSLESLDEQIKELLLANGGDINISGYPQIIREASEHGITQFELAKRITGITSGIDWRPYHRIDGLLENIMLKGSINEKESEAIIQAVQDQLRRPAVNNYILVSIKKRGFAPREKNSFEYDSFRNRWMTEEAWQKFQQNKIVVEWLKEDAHSLEEMAEISFRKEEDARYYLRNTHFLVPNVTTLTKSSSRAEEFSQIIDNESNLDKRYLKVLYHLDKSLPFRCGEREFRSIHDLLQATSGDRHLFDAAAESYQNGHILIWLKEAEPATAAKLTERLDYNSFLEFIYDINPIHSFFIGDDRFASPRQMMERARSDSSLWNKIARAAENHQLITWLSAIGRNDLVKGYEDYKKQLTAQGFYSEDELKLSLVQYLVDTIDEQSNQPSIETDPKEIKLLSIKGSRLNMQQVNMKISGVGYVVAYVSIDKSLQGIRLSNDRFTFWSQEMLNTNAVNLIIDPARLTRDKLYTFNILIKTSAGTLTVPCQVKVVFPVVSYMLQLLKYAMLGALFFAGIRYFTGFLTGRASWFNLGEISHQGAYYRQESFLLFFICLLLLAGGLVGAIFLIKKLEKI